MEKIKCPKCKSIMQEFDIKSKKASKYEDCIRRCIQCQIGASNAQINPRKIYFIRNFFTAYLIFI